MLFKPSILLSLFATSFALPAPAPEANLIARAQIPASVNCDGAIFTADVIRQTISNSRTPRYVGNKEYPDFFGNRSGSGKVFGNIPDSSVLYGQPLTSPAWTGGQPGKYRVVVNKNWGYVGVMQHLSDVSNDFKPCTVVPDVMPPNVNPPEIEPPNVPGRV